MSGMTQPNSSPKSILKSQGWEGGIHMHCPRTLGALGKPHFLRRAGTMTIHVYKGAEQAGENQVLKGPLLERSRPGVRLRASGSGSPAFGGYPVWLMATTRGETSWKGTGQLEGLHRAGAGSAVIRGAGGAPLPVTTSTPPLCTLASWKANPHTPGSLCVSVESVGPSRIAPGSLDLWTDSVPSIHV